MLYRMSASQRLMRVFFWGGGGGFRLSDTEVGCYGGDLHQINKMSLVTSGVISSQRRLMDVFNEG